MAEPNAVTNLPRPLPQSVRMAKGFTPNEMRALKAISGRSLTELMGGDPNDMEMAPDRTQAMIWIALRREGYDPSWDDAGNVEPVLDEPPPDPTPTGS